MTPDTDSKVLPADPETKSLLAEMLSEMQKMNENFIRVTIEQANQATLIKSLQAANLERDRAEQEAADTVKKRLGAVALGVWSIILLAIGGWFQALFSQMHLVRGH